jgi:hypothetical protein
MDGTTQTGGVPTGQSQTAPGATPTPVQGVDSDILGLLGHTHQKTQAIEQTTQKHDQILSKLEGLFKSETPREGAWHDKVLQAAIEAERQGGSMPLTVEISNELLKTQQANKALMEKLAAIEQKQQLKDNPAFQADQAAYVQIDQYMAQGLANVFGGNIPKPVAVAITQDLAQRIQEEQQTNPQRWAQIRSNPEAMRQIVRNAIAQTIPPEARRIQHQHQVENAVYEPEEILENIREANQLLRDPDVQKNHEHVQKLRQSIQRMREMYWEARTPGSNGRSRV